MHNAVSLSIAFVLFNNCGIVRSGDETKEQKQEASEADADDLLGVRGM